MKSAFVGLTIVTILVGCSREAQKNTDSSTSPGKSEPHVNSSLIPTNPIQITIIETAERKEWLKIKAEAATLFAAKDFDKLDDLAKEFRVSKASIANGIWKLEAVYMGIIPDVNESDDKWKNCLAAIHNWIQAKPDSITARVALADTLVAYGWKARGSEYANAVTETGWKLLAERLTEAVQVLKQAEKLNEKCPHYWTVFLTAAMGLGIDKPQYEILFQKAILSEPGFVGYYCQKAYYLSPRWHGQPGDMEIFLEKAADQVGGEEGDMFYARVTWYVQLLTRDVFDEHGFSWQRTDKGFEVIEKRYPDSLYVQNARAYMAVMGCDKTLAPRKLAAALHGQIDPRVWTSKENFTRLTHDLNPQ